MTYLIYTTKYDEVVRPLDLMDPDELETLARNLHVLCPVESFEPLKERLELLKAPSVPTAVTLLIDNSGSMRGPAISFAVGTAGIIATYLDRLGVPNEILGFTTKAWKGGDPREDYRAAGFEPTYPGRLNALRHIVYKQFDEQLKDVRNNLAAMFREGLLKENIDGEAVQWASRRLREYPTKNRILLVISDGAPVDDATLQANGYSTHSRTEEQAAKEEVSSRSILENSMLGIHLKQVVAELNDAGDIKLDAIGILHDVSTYYGVGDRINKLEDLAPVAIEKLEKLLL